jgi:hypothetical protein
MTEPKSLRRRRLVALGPFVLVALACAFSLVVLRSETTPASNLNDSAFHLQMVKWADHQITEGRVPLDGWFPDLSMGSSFFHHYQSLPYALTAYAARLTHLGDQTTYLWVQYLLLALWPISVYLGARLLSMNRWAAGAAALVSPLIVSQPGYGYEHASYTWQGYGLYTQLFGMALFPITLGLTWRAVSKGKGYALAALFLALSIATHLITGYLAVIMVGVWVVLAWRDLGRRALRALAVIAGGLLTAAWVLVPLLADRNFAAQSEFYRGTIFNDSYGAPKILGWLFTGQLFDHGRFPIFTLLVGVGLVVSAIRARRSESARAVLALFVVSLLLYFGRATWGAATNALPGSGDLQMHRFILGVHMAGILLAGTGVVAVAQWLYAGASALLKRFRSGIRRPALVWTGIAVVMLAILAPAWVERAHYDQGDAGEIAAQRATDASGGRDFLRLVAEATARGDGRVYAGTRGNWGPRYVIGQVPGYAMLSNADADAIGFSFRTVQSLSTDVEANFDDTNIAQYQMMNIKYVILPDTQPPSVPANLLGRAGRHSLYEVSTSGYFQVVDIDRTLAYDRAHVMSGSAAFRNSSNAMQSEYPSIAFDGAAALPPTVSTGTLAANAPGVVAREENVPDDGWFGATVRANRRAVVLLKESFDPRWRVTVDGVAAKAAFIAPSLVGVEVPAGTHTVVFAYRPYAHYPLLIGIGLLTLALLAWWPLAVRFAQQRRRRGGEIGLADLQQPVG